MKHFGVHLTIALLTHVTSCLAEDNLYFDLICSGNRTDTFKEISRAVTFEVRVDLNGDQYCIDDCSYIEKIREVQPSEIIFEEMNSSFTNGFIVYRTTGHFYRNRLGPPADSLADTEAFRIDGQCVKAPFIPLPKLAF